jgi:hypothetical protein
MDGHHTTMTIRDQYAIMHHLPVSNKPWLNHVILEGRKMLKLPALATV